MARIEVKARLDLPPGVEVLGYERCGDPPAKDQVIIDYLNTHCDSHCDVVDFPFHFGPARSPEDHCPGTVSKRQDCPPDGVAHRCVAVQGGLGQTVERFSAARQGNSPRFVFSSTAAVQTRNEPTRRPAMDCQRRVADIAGSRSSRRNRLHSLQAKEPATPDEWISWSLGGSARESAFFSIARCRPPGRCGTPP